MPRASKATAGSRAGTRSTERAARKAPGKKAPANKARSRKAPAKKVSARKGSPSKVTTRKTTSKQGAKKAPAKKAAAKKAAKKAPAKKAAAKKAPAKKAPAKKAAKKAPAKKAAAKKAPAKKAAAKKAPAKKAAAKKAAKKGLTKSPFDKAFVEEQREALMTERARLSHDVDALDAEATELAMMREPGDVQFDEESGEGDTLAVERERDLALSAQFRTHIEDIDHALRKIDAGMYGVCEVSGLAIPKERLRAIPWARERVEYKVGGFGRT
jgi:RNA polymerase-binding transcription factor DksA